MVKTRDGSIMLRADLGPILTHAVLALFVVDSAELGIAEDDLAGLPDDI